MSTATSGLDFPVFEPSASANRRGTLGQRIMKALIASGEARARREVAVHMRLRTDQELMALGWSKADIAHLRG